MFKSKKGVCMKSNEELQSYIVCLRKQLAISLNENRILKIKIQRFENDLQKKETQIQNLVASNKDFDVKKLVKQHGKGFILNMQKQIHILEEKLLQNDILSDTKSKSRNNSDYKLNKQKVSKESVNSTESQHSSNKSVISRHSLEQRKARQLVESKNEENRSERDDSKNFVSRSEKEEDWKFDDRCLNIIRMIKEQTNAEKYDNKVKDNQISYLLNKLKSFKKVASDSAAFSEKSEFSLQADRRRTGSSLTLNSKNDSSQPFKYRSKSDFIEQESPYLEMNSVEKQLNSSCTFSKHRNLDSKSDINVKRIKGKTAIEYSPDSEVSSDEEYVWRSSSIRNNEDQQYIYTNE